MGKEDAIFLLRDFANPCLINRYGKQYKKLFVLRCRSTT